MAKSLTIKVGEFTNQQGETKGNYVRVGSLMQGNDGGEYIILDPTVSLAGCLTRQNFMNHKNGKQVRDSLMVGIFDNNGQNNGGAQNSPQAPQGNQQQQGAPAQNNAPAQQGREFSDDIPF